MIKMNVTEDRTLILLPAKYGHIQIACHLLLYGAHGATASLTSSCVQWTFQIFGVVAFKTVAGHEILRGPISKRAFINDNKCTGKMIVVVYTPQAE